MEVDWQERSTIQQIRQRRTSQESVKWRTREGCAADRTTGCHAGRAIREPEGVQRGPLEELRVSCLEESGAKWRNMGQKVAWLNKNKSK